MDNRGNRLLVSENDSAINLPAVGAAYAVKKYSAQDPDELSFEVCLFHHIFVHLVSLSTSLVKTPCIKVCIKPSALEIYCLALYSDYICILGMKASQHQMICLCIPFMISVPKYNKVFQSSTCILVPESWCT